MIPRVIWLGRYPIGIGALRPVRIVLIANPGDDTRAPDLVVEEERHDALGVPFWAPVPDKVVGTVCAVALVDLAREG